MSEIDELFVLAGDLNGLVDFAGRSDYEARVMKAHLRRIRDRLNVLGRERMKLPEIVANEAELSTLSIDVKEG